MLRAVLDTSVIVAGLRSCNGASYRLLTHVTQGTIRPVLTTALLLEYEAVLKRPEQRLAHGLDVDDIDRFLAGLASLSDPVDVLVSWRPQLADPDDEMVLEAALGGRVEILVTHNVKDFASATQQFALRVLTPGALVNELKP